MMLAGVVLAVGGVAGLGLWDAERGADRSVPPAAGSEPDTASVAVETESPPATEVELDVPVEAEPPPVQAAPPPEPATTERRAKVPPAAPAPARLTVVVIPWGDVWIDGKPQGASPLKNKSLKPGRYKIAAGQGSASKTQTIRLRPGQRRTVQFDLTD
jgi:serine/threonine-protein kinase